MAGAVLVPCGVRLRSDFDALAPDRDKRSDGWIGDTAHQQEVSDHNPDETGSVPIHDADRVNEVHAVDVTADLRTFDLTMWKVVDFLVGRCRAGAETRLRYIIWDHIIWEASNGWRSRPYTGASPHTEHAHFSFSYDTAREASTASWHLEDIPVALTAADKTWLADKIDQAATDAAERVWSKRVERVNPTPGETATVSMGALLQFSEETSHDDAVLVIDTLKPLIEERPALGLKSMGGA